MAAGRRRSGLEVDVDAMFRRDFAQRVLAFDGSCVSSYAKLFAMRRAAGRPLEGLDGPIAAIAYSIGASVATRNTLDFAGCGLTVINPWTGAVST